MFLLELRIFPSIEKQSQRAVLEYIRVGKKTTNNILYIHAIKIQIRGLLATMKKEEYIGEKENAS